jgi:hypothetical protein
MNLSCPISFKFGVRWPATVRRAVSGDNLNLINLRLQVEGGPFKISVIRVHLEIPADSARNAAVACQAGSAYLQHPSPQY